jgi:hypothetical protein
MLNLQTSYTDDSKDRKLAIGVNPNSLQEGSALVSVIEDGYEKVKLSEGTKDEKLVGFAYGTWFVPSTLVMTASATLTGEVDTVQLFPNCVADSIKITGTSTFAAKTSADAVAAAGDFFLDTATGTLTIKGAENEVVVIAYRRNLTVSEQQTMFGSHSINGNANSLFEQVTVWKGNGEIWTDQYDTSADWSSATEAYTGANGLLTSDNTSGCVAGRIIGKPTASNPFLGIAINLA